MYSFLISLCSLLYFGDIYQFSIPSIYGGSAIQFSDFKGKKILVVNTASGSIYAPQYASLERLYQQYKDKLVVVAIPSNDFQHEGRGEAELLQFVNSAYQVHFLLAGQLSVMGAGQSTLYKWLTTGGENGGMTSTVTNDFQKYLIGTDGRVIGYFNGAVDPMDQSLQDLINAQ